MSNTNKQHKKKVERAKRVKVVIAKRRESIDKSRKEAAKKERLEKQFGLKQMPIRNTVITEEEAATNMSARLRDNLRILKELEAQHEADIKHAEEQRHQDKTCEVISNAPVEQPPVEQQQVQDEQPKNKGQFIGKKPKFKFGGSANSIMSVNPNQSQEKI